MYLGKSEGGSRSLKYGTDFNTWLLAKSAFGPQTRPDELLRENKMILVSTNVPVAIPLFNASRKESVAAILLWMR